jgi:lipoprotein-anchoring transpeptidase ErfK/SrfK
MMRRLFAAALAATLVFSVVPTASQAANDPTQTQLLLKKKKLMQQLKALEAQTAALDKSLAAKLKPAKVKASPLVTASITQIKVKKVKIARPVRFGAAPLRAQVAQLRPCGSFLQCLFGNKHRKTTGSVQKANFGSYQNAGLSGNTSNRVVDWNETKYPVGSLIVRTPERALYFVSGKGEAIRYSVGVGKEGMQWSGVSRIDRKAEWPSWTPPQEMITREAAKGHIIPPFMEGGPGNPLGARALYIGGKIYRVHGTNNEASIGGAVSSGCIRMMNADVIDLYGRVKVGAKIYVYQ